MRVLVVGANFCNRGAESMLLTLIACIQSEISQADFSVWSYSADDQKRSGTIVHSEPNGIKVEFELSYNQKNIWLLLAQGALSIVTLRAVSKLVGRFSPFIRDIGQADAVIDISGFALTGDRPWWRHLVYLLESRTARSCGTPFIAMTQSFGPFRSKWQKLIARMALATSCMIAARGATSGRYLETLGFTEGKDFLIAPDMTYLFDPAPESFSQEVLRQVARPRIAVIPNTNVFHRSARQSEGDRSENAYVTTMRHLCQTAIVEHGCEIVFVPHEGNSLRFDDLALIEIIRDDPLIEAHSIVLETYLKASLLKLAIIECDAVITSRYHGMIAALSGCVPAFVLGWADKYEESAAMAGSSGFAFNFADCDPHDIVRHFSRFWAVRGDIRQALAERFPQNRSAAKSAMDIMVKSLRHRAAR